MRRVFFGLALLAIVWLGVELGSWALLRASGSNVADTEARMQRVAVAGEGRVPRGRDAPVSHQTRGRVVTEVTEEAVHPYLGFVSVPQANERAGATLDALGFPGGGEFPREPRADRYRVAVFGGSLAHNLAASGELDRSLAELAKGRRVEVMNVALPGWKQPQSLFALAYLLTLGAQIDAAIVLDGLNEIAVRFEDAEDTFAVFPARWSLRVASLDADTPTRSLIGEIGLLGTLRQEGAERVARSRLHASPTVALVWTLSDHWLESRIEARRVALDERRLRAFEQYVATGPRWPLAPGDAGTQQLVDVWLRSARSMRALADANGIRLFHFLQPNQHVAGSKPIGPAEAAVAIAGGERWAELVAEGYPLLRAGGEQLRAEGEAFHDLTGVFANVSEPLYVDNCCHVGRRGNALIADAIAAVLRAALAPGAPVPAAPAP